MLKVFPCNLLLAHLAMLALILTACDGEVSSPDPQVGSKKPMEAAKEKSSAEARLK